MDLLRARQDKSRARGRDISGVHHNQQGQDLPHFHFISLHGVNKHRPVPCTLTDVATSVKTSLFIIAVKGKPEKKAELINHNLRDDFQKLL